MNFFERQEDARNASRVLLAAFALAVAGVVGVVTFFTLRRGLAVDFIAVFSSPLALLVAAMLGLLLLEEKAGRSLASSTALTAVAAAILWVAPSIQSGVSWSFWLDRAIDFALAPRTMLVWAVLVWMFVTDGASLRRNVLHAVALLPAAMVVCLAINLTLAVGALVAAQPASAPVAAIAALITLGIVLGASRRRMGQLKAGGSAVAAAMGAQPLVVRAGDKAATQLRNVVEEMAIAASVPVPAIYVLEQPSINALAAGWTPSDASITVTRGAMQNLSRDGLQALVAHQFSHIVNGDIELHTRLLGLLHGLDAISGLGRRLMRSMTPNRMPYPIGIPGMVVGALVVSAGYLGTLLADMIRAALAHRRKYLADAAAVQFTRQKAGLIGVFRHVLYDEHGATLSVAEADALAPMLFTAGSTSSLFATHPPLELRMLAVDPTALDPVEPAGPRPRVAGSLPPPQPGAAARGTAQVAAAVAAVAAIPAAVVAATAGTADAVAVQAAGKTHQALPVALADLARQPALAPTLACSLFVDRDAAVQAAQLQRIQSAMGEAPVRQVRALLPAVQALPHAQRVALALIAGRALRARPPEPLRALKDTIHALIHADGRAQVFEYALGAMVESQLSEALHPGAAAAKLRLDAVEEESALTLAVLAAVGHADDAEAGRAFQRGLAVAAPRLARKYQRPADWVAGLDSALARLDGLLPFGKKILLDALVATIQHDGTVGEDEYELLRAICTRLHCPLPPRVLAVPAAAPA